MNPKELRNVALSAMDYDSCTDEMIDTMAKHILDTVNADDDDRLTEKSIVGHPMFQKVTSYGNWGECKQHFVLGDFEVVWEGPDEFGIKWDNELLFPQPRTWGELRCLAKMLNAKLESA